MEPDVALAALRFGHDASAMLVWGACAYLAALVPSGLAQGLGRRLLPGLLGLVAVTALTTAATLPVEAAAIGDGWADAADPGTLGAVLWHTGVGRAWQAQAVAALVLAGAAFGPHRLGAMAVAAGLDLVTLALTGHAAMHEGWLGLAHRANDALHVLSAGAWFGALLTLVPCLGALADPERRRDATLALRRFSSAGHGAVALVLVTGAANTALVLGRLPTDLASPYQGRLVLKIALVAVMVALAVLNRYAVVPRMAARPGEAVRLVRTVTLAEIGLGLVVLALVAVFGLADPA